MILLQSKELPTFDGALYSWAEKVARQPIGGAHLANGVASRYRAAICTMSPLSITSSSMPNLRGRLQRDSVAEVTKASDAAAPGEVFRKVLPCRVVLSFRAEGRRDRTATWRSLITLFGGGCRVGSHSARSRSSARGGVACCWASPRTIGMVRRASWPFCKGWSS